MRWLFLRGLVREARHWGAFPAEFSQALGVDRPLTLDLPGVGTEHGRLPPLSVRELTDDLRGRFLRAGGGDGPWALLGISLGGMIALDWLSRFPGDFQRGVVLNTSAGDAGRLWERFSFRQLPTVARAFFAEPLERELQILKLTSGRSAQDHATVAEVWAGYAREAPFARAVFFRQLLAGARSKMPTQVTVPTLVLASRGDRLVSHQCSERIAERLGLPIELHDSAGHDLPMDDAAWVIERVASWVSKPARSTTAPELSPS